MKYRTADTSIRLPSGRPGHCSQPFALRGGYPGRAAGFLWLVLLLMACMPDALAQASPGARNLYVRSLAATCATCHGTDGRAAASSSLPSIAGQDKAYLVAQLKAFRDGSRPATVMHQLSKAYQDAQIELLAEYFAAQGK